MTMGKAIRLFRDEQGASAIEFAICSTAFFAMLFGGIYASIVGYTSASLHGAVEAAARCRALGTTCKDDAAAKTYATSVFHQITSATPTFTVDTTQACGNQVTGTITVYFDWIVGRTSKQLSAQSCFPTQSASIP